MNGDRALPDAAEQLASRFVLGDDLAEEVLAWEQRARALKAELAKIGVQMSWSIELRLR